MKKFQKLIPIVFLLLIISCKKEEIKKEDEPIKVVPKKDYTIITASEPINGVFTLSSFYGLTYTIEINGTNYKKTLKTTLNDTWVWQGTLIKKNDSTYNFNYQYSANNYSGYHYIAAINKNLNSVLSFKLADSTLYIERAFQKINGDTNSIWGKYRCYDRSESLDKPSYSDTTIYYSDFDSTGKVHYYDSRKLIDTTFQWTKTDLLNKKYFLLSIDKRVFLINKNWDVLYKKQ